MVDWARVVKVVQEMPGPLVTAEYHCEVVSVVHIRVQAYQRAALRTLCSVPKEKMDCLRNQILCVAEFGTQVMCTHIGVNKGQPRFLPASIGRLRVGVEYEKLGEGCAKIICLVPETKCSK